MIRSLALFYGFYAIHASVRTLGINWGFLEEMKRQQASFLLTCRWSEILYCLYAFQKHKIPVVGNFDWDTKVGFIDKLGIRLWQTSKDLLPDEGGSNFGQQIRVPQLWVPLDDASLQGYSILQLVQMAQNQQKKILPVHCSMRSSFVLSSTIGMRFPYPFSKVVVLMGNPIQIDDIPDQQACSRVQHTLNHLDDLAHAMLQKMHAK